MDRPRHGTLKPAGLWGGVPVYIDPLVPLEKTLADGTREHVLCWQFGGSIYVHPDRWDAFLVAVPLRPAE